MIIDAYTHITPIRYLKQLGMRIGEPARAAIERLEHAGEKYRHFWDVGERVRVLKEYGIDHQVVAVHHFIDPNNWAEGELLLELCRVLNDEMAEICKRSGEALIGIGAAPLNALDIGGREEMRRAVRELGLRGFMVETNVRGVPIDKFEAFWEEANELSCAVYVHPNDPHEKSCRSYEDEYDMMHVFGWPFETTLILTRLVFSGTLLRNPNVKVVAHHAGGMIPFFAGRINESYSRLSFQLRPEQTLGVLSSGEAIDHFKTGQILYDTAVGGNPHAIMCAISVFGHDKMVFATDFPWGPNGGLSRLERYPKIVESLGLDADQLEDVFFRNASRLLRI